jgi:TonB family protein
MTTKHRAAFLGGLLAAMLMMQAPAIGQQRLTEMDLLQRAQQQPAEISNYLELAQLYMNARRFDDAEQMLMKALAVVRQGRIAPMPPSAAGIATTQSQGFARTPSGVVQGLAAPVRVGGDIKEPKKIKDVKPLYPDGARAAGVQGVVILEVIITYDGTVREVRVLRSIAMLDDAAADAVRQWQFTPTLLNNQPVEVVMTVTVNFTLG